MRASTSARSGAGTPSRSRPSRSTTGDEASATLCAKSNCARRGVGQGLRAEPSGASAHLVERHRIGALLERDDSPALARARAQPRAQLVRWHGLDRHVRLGRGRDGFERVMRHDAKVVDDETIGGEDLGRAHETGDVRHLEAHKGAPRCEARAIFGARERGRDARALSTSDAQMMRRWRARPTAFVPCHRAPSASARASVSHGSGLRCRTDKSRAATS